ncbi:MAG: hypothetical protein WBB28_01290 [Crinalium sp.]
MTRQMNRFLDAVDEAISPDVRQISCLLDEKYRISKDEYEKAVKAVGTAFFYDLSVEEVVTQLRNNGLGVLVDTCLKNADQFKKKLDRVNFFN